ncbi:unnamed protein product, partial [Amoebophrya sp. A120]
NNSAAATTRILYYLEFLKLIGKLSLGRDSLHETLVHALLPANVILLDFVCLSQFLFSTVEEDPASPVIPICLELKQTQLYCLQQAYYDCEVRDDETLLNAKSSSSTTSSATGMNKDASSTTQDPQGRSTASEKENTNLIFAVVDYVIRDLEEFLVYLDTTVSDFIDSKTINLANNERMPCTAIPEQVRITMTKLEQRLQPAAKLEL